MSSPDSLIHFEAEPFEIGSWLIVLLPQAASANLPSRGQVMVKGTINGASFQTPLEPDGNGSHWFRVDKQLQKAALVREGKSAVLVIESTKDWPEPVIPTDLQHALNSAPEQYDLWQRITPMARWEWIRWIGSSDKPETRQRHIEVTLSKLKAGMRRPCCFNRNMCCVPKVSKGGVLLAPTKIIPH